LLFFPPNGPNLVYVSSFGPYSNVYAAAKTKWEGRVAHSTLFFHSSLNPAAAAAAATLIIRSTQTLDIGLQASYFCGKAARAQFPAKSNIFYSVLLCDL
jgi:hypothetical protein